MEQLWLRNNTGFLGRAEQRSLAWLVKRLPSSITPDTLTAIGFFGATVTCVSYALSSFHLAWLWCASIGLAINWFGDSLDGTLARFRRIERPRYGFFLDNALDIVSQALFALGFALSGLIRVELTLVALIAFLMLSMLSLLRAKVTTDFQLAYGPFGLTELRLAFILINALMFFVPPRPLFAYGITWGYPDLLSAAWSLLMIIIFAVSLIKTAMHLSVIEPSNRSRSRDTDLQS